MKFFFKLIFNNKWFFLILICGVWLLNVCINIEILKKNLLLGIKDFILIILDSKNGRILKNLSLNGF